MDLKDCRDKIDIIDSQIFELISKRFKIVKSVIEYKIKNDLDIYQKRREDEVILKIKKLCDEYQLNRNFGEKLIQLIMDESKNEQQKILIELQTKN